MLSQATSVDGQGVGSAYMEMVALVKECSDLFDVKENSSSNKFDISHVHTVNLRYRLRFNKHHINVMYVHFIPSTLDGSIKINKLFFSIFKKYVTNVYRKADEIVVVNPAYISKLEELGINKDNITYIPNFVDHDAFKKLTDEEVKSLKEKYNIPQDKFVVLGCGQVQTRKSVLEFVETAKRNPDKVFVWAGGFSFGKITDGYKELKAIMDNPPENVKFIGIIPRPKMNEVFNISDMLFMPSFAELFPMSILEAANCEKPVLLRDLSLYEDILFKNKGCYAFGNNVDEFDKEIKRIASNKSSYEKLVKGSMEISRFYNKEYVKNFWREYYPRILNKWSNKKKIRPSK